MPVAPVRSFELAHTYRGIPLDCPLSLPSSLLPVLTARAAMQEGDPFVTAVSPSHDTETLSYGAMDLLSRRLAGWLRGELQLRCGAVVGLLPANDVHSVVAVFALLRAGYAILLLNPSDPWARLRQQIEALDVAAVIQVAALADDPRSEALLVPDPSRLAAEFAIDPKPEPQPHMDAFICGTSGSTAAAKLVVQSHYNATVNATAVCRHHRLRVGDQLLGCLPIHHVNGLHFTLLATLASGAHAILAHGFDPFGYPRLIERFRPRLASVVPSILEALLETWRTPHLPGGFEYFISAAAPLSSETARSVTDRLGTRVLQGYGLTETTNFSTMMPSDLSAEAYRQLAYDAEIPSVGTALFGNEVAVLSPEGTRVPLGSAGEICIRGHSVMMRYAGNPAATSRAFHGGWFHSQDLGFEIELAACRQRFLVITGRHKNIAKVQGETVSLDEMNRVLRSLPSVRDAVCLSRPQRLLGEEIVAAVVLSPVATSPDLREHLRANFGANVLPRRIVELDGIPRTPTGKIDRAKLLRAVEARLRHGSD